MFFTKTKGDLNLARPDWYIVCIFLFSNIKGRGGGGGGGEGVL